MSERRFSSLVLCETTANQLMALSPRKQNRFLSALIQFGLYGKEPEFSGDNLAIWIPMRDFIINSRKRMSDWNEKRRENGCRGGRPRKDAEGAETDPREGGETGCREESGEKPSRFPENLDAHNDNDNDNDNINARGGGEDFADGGGDLPGPGENPPAKHDGARILWNSLGLPSARKPFANLAYTQQSDMAACLGPYTKDEILGAVRRYAEESGSLDYPYRSLASFLKNGIDRYAGPDARGKPPEKPPLGYDPAELRRAMMPWHTAVYDSRGKPPAGRERRAFYAEYFGKLGREIPKDLLAECDCLEREEAEAEASAGEGREAG